MKAKKEKTVLEIVKVWPKQMIEVRAKAYQWKMSVESVLNMTVDEFNQKRGWKL